MHEFDQFTDYQQSLEEYQEQPPLATDYADAVDIKKLDSPQAREFLTAIILFAKKAGVWQILDDALANESFFDNQSSADIPAPKNRSTEKSRTSHGLKLTGKEQVKGINLADLEVRDLNAEDPAMIIKILKYIIFHLTGIFNNPYYLDVLFDVAEHPHVAPKKKKLDMFRVMMWWKRFTRQAVGVNDLALDIGDTDKPRSSRTRVFFEGLVVSYWTKKKSRKDKLFGNFLHRPGRESGRKQARSVVVIGENADVTGSALMIAELAMGHFLVGLSRDGEFGDVDRQVELAKRSIELLKVFVRLVGRSAQERIKLLEWYVHNIVGTIEANPEKALVRAKALYQTGVRTFKVYSPEPNNQLLATVMALKKLEQEDGWEPIEIFAGQVVKAKQAKQLEKAGADAIYWGVGGGGRCDTGNKANIAIKWAQDLFQAKGLVKKPQIVQGGANEKAGVTMALGGSGIGVVGKIAACIESPGGTFYFYNTKTDQWFIFYGGEASDRMRAIAGRVDLMNRAINTEGETTTKFIDLNPDAGHYPIALQVLARLLETVSTSVVFQNAFTIEEMQREGKLLFESDGTIFQKNPHNIDGV